MSRQRTLLIFVGLLLTIASTTSPRLSDAASEKQPVDNAGAAAYMKLLPELAAAHKKKLDEELAQLKKQTDELSPRVLDAQKKTGIDLNSVAKEIRSAAATGDANQTAQAQSKIFNTYEPQLAKLLQVSAINPQREIERLMTVVNLSNARRVDSSFIAAGGSDESKREQPPATTPPPDVKLVTFTAPFTSEGHVGNDVLSQASTGRLSVANEIHVAGSTQKLAFITQDLVVERGMRRVRAYVRFEPTTFGTFANALLGYSSAEAIVNLRLLDGSTVVASDRLSLSRSIAAVIGGSHTEGARPVTLQFDYTRPAPDDETTYTLVAEIEGWAGAGGFSDAMMYANATVRQIQVYLHRSTS
jgi:hypothetical protein